MNISNKSAFYYHADANALGGILNQPLERIVSTGASVSLAQAGGFSSARSEKFSLDGLISVESAHVHVSGSEHKEHGGYRTIATAVVERLNVLEVVTADRIVAQVSLMHPYGHGPAQVSLLGTQFVNLKVNGAPVNVKPDPRMFGVGRDQEAQTDAPRLNDLLRVAELQHKENAETQRRLADRLGARFATTDPWTDIEETGDAVCTLVQLAEVEVPAANYGHVIHLPDFGNIFLAELTLNRFAAELTMLRIEMGCMGAGSVSACSARSNGRPCP